MERRLRYSERKRLAETGSLGPLEHAVVPDPVAVAVDHLLTRLGANPNWRSAFVNAMVEHFGLSSTSAQPYVNAVHNTRQSVEAFLDMCEIAVEKSGANSALSFNRIFERHRFGFRLDGDQARQVGSPALDEVVVGPALLAASRPDWQEVERSYREALDHQRGGANENDDALTAAHAALEAAMKASGIKGNDFGQLTKAFRSSGIVPPQLAGVPNALDDLLKRSAALRNTMGDAHGKEAGADPVPQALVDLAIHWTGAFIVFLAETVGSK